jgi:hypothetical protein
VTGEVNPAALDDLIRLCAELDKRRRAEHHAGDAGDPAPDTLAEEALEQAIIGKAVDLLSGPGGLASFLRRQQLGARLGGPSLPLDVGVRRYPGGDPAGGDPAGPALPVPRRLRPARGRLRGPPPAAPQGRLTDQRKRLRPVLFLSPPGCHSPVGLDRSPQPDGTTTALNKDKTKIIHSHSPPVRPG